MTEASAAPASAEVISLSDERRASIRKRLLQRSAREVAEKAFARAALMMRMAPIQRRTSLRSMNRASSRRSCR